MTAIWWLRRDLRLSDNPTLQAALETGNVIPAFILDPHLLKRTPERRQAFLFDGLRALDTDLRRRGSYLVARHGEPLETLGTLLDESGARAIFAEEDYTPYSRRRDSAVANSLPLQLVLGQTVHHPEFVLKSDGNPYTVFTPYSRAWKSRAPESVTAIPVPERISTPAGIPSSPIPELPASEPFPGGETPALERLEAFMGESIYTYAGLRNRMDLPATSALSPYLRFGMLGMRQAVHQAQEAIMAAPDSQTRHSAQVWLNELIWREFYIQVLYHFPHVAHSAFNPAMAYIPWRNQPSEFEAWKQGQTGVPVVDAAMRQLRATGWMHNRARMIVASFLVKDMLVDWRWGERWFMQTLLDGDPAANNGGWQWTAGTGTDAAPYFRIFNPVLQSQKFDPHGAYIRRWVPELAELEAPDIHAPWRRGLSIHGYPDVPIVDREGVRDRTLQAFKLSKSLYEAGRRELPGSDGDA